MENCLGKGMDIHLKKRMDTDLNKGLDTQFDTGTYLNEEDFLQGVGVLVDGAALLVVEPAIGEHELAVLKHVLLRPVQKGG